MFHLIYISRETAKFTHSTLLELLAQSRDKNKRLGITGLLLYRGGNFMQVLEGDEATVLEVYGSIRHDARHHGVVTVLKEAVGGRRFPHWSMAFQEIGLKEGDLPEGYSDFLRDPWSSLENPDFSDSVRTFLRLFILSTESSYPHDGSGPVWQ